MGVCPIFCFSKDVHINFTGIQLFTIIVWHTPKKLTCRKLNAQFSNTIQEEILKFRTLSLGGTVAKLPKAKNKVRVPSKELHFKDLYLQAFTFQQLYVCMKTKLFICSSGTPHPTPRRDCKVKTTS